MRERDRRARDGLVGVESVREREGPASAREGLAGVGQRETGARG